MVSGTKPGSGKLHLLAVGTYSPDDAAIALRSAITKKFAKPAYADVKRTRGLRSIYLLVYYDVAILKNTPAALDIDVVNEAQRAMGAIPTSFDGVFVLMFPGGDTTSGRKVYSIPVA